MPRVTVIGTGYLGLTHAVCLADLGHDVLAIDVDAEKIAMAASGEAPFFEPGLEPLLRKNLDAGRLRFTMSFAEVGAFGEVHFLCVGTPEGESGRADLGAVFAAAETLAPHLAAPCLVVGKSTVPVGTARQVMTRMRAVAPAGNDVGLAWNPEFLREGFAVQDSLAPDRIVLGVTSDGAAEMLREVYRGPLETGAPLLLMDLETAELVKVAANAFLATKISFINAMAEVCEQAGADVIPLAEALGYDARIGRRFLSPGLGYGGGCLPKDIRGFRATAADLGVSSLESLLATVDEINLGRRERVVALTREAAGGSLAGRRVAVPGDHRRPLLPGRRALARGRMDGARARAPAGLAGAGQQGSFGGLDDVGQQHGAGHRADSARHRGQPAGHLGDLGSDVTDQAGIGPGDAHVDYGRAGLDHVRGQQARPARRHHHDVRGPGVRGEILGAGVAQGHGGVLGAPGQQQAEGAAHGDPAADDGHVGARDGHVVAAQQFHDAARGARQRAVLAEDQLAQADRVQPVRVLGRVHPVEHGVGVEAARQRQLDDVPGAGGVLVQLVDDRFHLGLGRVSGQVAADGRDPDLRAVPVLAVHVGVAAGVVADQDRAEARHDTAGGQRGDPFLQPGADLRRQGFAVEQLCGHVRSPQW